ncbi:MAG: hypothetical protein RDV48_11175 [Candidatus Eremiobacteraeota bacterium]|nr:hypothetical protein [Candidatus Eremiobacteraeota bacterium]
MRGAFRLFLISSVLIALFIVAGTVSISHARGAYFPSGSRLTDDAGNVYYSNGSRARTSSGTAYYRNGSRAGGPITIRVPLGTDCGVLQVRVSGRSVSGVLYLDLGYDQFLCIDVEDGSYWTEQESICSLSGR